MCLCVHVQSCVIVLFAHMHACVCVMVLFEYNFGVCCHASHFVLLLEGHNV